MSQIVGYFSNGNPIYKNDLTQQSVFVNCDFRHSRLSELDLESISFFQCDFTNASFRESKFTDVVFNACILDYIDAYSTDFIGVDIIYVSMKSSLLTKAKFLVKNWYNVDLSYSKIFDMDMQEANASGICSLGYQHEVQGQPIRLLDQYFTVDVQTPMTKLLGGGTIKRISNSVIEESFSKSKKIPKSLFFYLREIWGLGTFHEYMGDNYQWLQKKLNKSRKN